MPDPTQILNAATRANFLGDMGDSNSALAYSQGAGRVFPDSSDSLIGGQSFMRGFTRINTKKSQPLYLTERINNASGTVGGMIFIKKRNSSQIEYMTNKFYLSSMEINLKERAQIQNTFGAASVYLFGESARIYSFTGTALEHATVREFYKGEYFQGSSLMHLYNTHLKGSSLVDEGNVAIMRIMNHTIWGYPLGFNYRNVAQADKYIEFGMSWVIVDHTLDLDELVTTPNLEDHYKVLNYINSSNSEYADILTKVLFAIEKFTTPLDSLFSSLYKISSSELETKKSELVNELSSLKIQLINNKAAIPDFTFFIKEQDIDDYITLFQNWIYGLDRHTIPVNAKREGPLAKLLQIKRFVFNKLTLMYSGVSGI